MYISKLQHNSKNIYLINSASYGIGSHLQFSILLIQESYRSMEKIVIHSLTHKRTKSSLIEDKVNQKLVNVVADNTDFFKT